MSEKSFGTMIATLRKEKGMTQLDLARKMGVTDKAPTDDGKEVAVFYHTNTETGEVVTLAT